MGTDPSKGSNYFCSTCPVDNVSWNDIQEFIVRLNRKTGKKHRLPSEAEWEYAARAGTTTNSAIGIDQTSGIKGDNSTTTEPVGREKSNAFGLFDMHGNVWEWVADCWHENYVEAPPNGSAWLNVCLNDARVLRGGSRYSGHLERRSATRLSYPPDTRTNSFGFRLARDHN